MFVRVAFTSSPIEAERIRALLEAGGFHPAPLNTSAHVTLAGAEQGYHVEVPQPEAPAVREFLRHEGCGKSVTR